MSMEFMRNALFGRLPHSSPVTVVGGEDVRANIAAQLQCKPEDIERELRNLLGLPVTYKPSVDEMKALLKQDLERDKEAPCRKRGAAEKGTGPDPATRNDSTKDGNEPSERSGNV